MKKIYAAAALFIVGCSVVTVLSSCNKNTLAESTSSNTTEKQLVFSTDVDGTAYSQGDDGYKYVVTPGQPSEENTTGNITASHSFTHPPIIEQTTNRNKTTVKATVTEKTSSTKLNISNETVKNEANGILVLFKSDGVSKGSTATISVIGEAGKTYSIDFYKNANTVSQAHGLGNMKADENGMAIWTFEIESDCESGNRKVIIRETGSDKFVQTSINIK